MSSQLKAMNADIKEHPDGLTIKGKSILKGANLDCKKDHRIAMSLAIAAMMADGDSTLKDSEYASVSYPNFWDDLAKLRNLDFKT